MLRIKEKKVLKEIKVLLEFKKNVNIILFADDITSKVTNTSKGVALANFLIDENINSFTKGNEKYPAVYQEVAKLLDNYESVYDFECNLRQGYDLCKNKLSLLEIREYEDNNGSHKVKVRLNLYDDFRSFLIRYSQEEDFDYIAKNFAINLFNHSLCIDTIIDKMLLTNKIKNKKLKLIK